MVERLTQPERTKRDPSRVLRTRNGRTNSKGVTRCARAEWQRSLGGCESASSSDGERWGRNASMQDLTPSALTQMPRRSARN